MADVVRFYLPSTGAAAVSPAYYAMDYPCTTRLAAVTTKITSALTAFGQVSYGNTGVAKTAGIMQYVSAAQSAREWTTADSIKCQGRCLATSNFTTAYLYLVIRVVSNDGGTFRGTLYAGVSPTDWSEAWPGVNRSIAGGAGSHVHVQNSVKGQANDRIVMDIGLQGNQNSGWDNSVIYFGDAVSTDLPENETATDDYNAWIEFTEETGGGGDVTRPLTGVSG